MTWILPWKRDVWKPEPVFLRCSMSHRTKITLQSSFFKVQSLREPGVINSGRKTWFLTGRIHERDLNHLWGRWRTITSDMCCSLYITVVLRLSICIVPFLHWLLDATVLWEVLGRASRSDIDAILPSSEYKYFHLHLHCYCASLLASLYCIKGVAGSLLMVNHHTHLFQHLIYLVVSDGCVDFCFCV